MPHHIVPSQVTNAFASFIWYARAALERNHTRELTQRETQARNKSNRANKTQEKETCFVTVRKTAGAHATKGLFLSIAVCFPTQETEQHARFL